MSFAQTYCTVQRVYREQCWLYSFTAAGRKELLNAVTVTCRLDSCTSSEDGLSIILLSPPPALSPEDPGWSWPS